MGRKRRVGNSRFLSAVSAKKNIVPLLELRPPPSRIAPRGKKVSSARHVLRVINFKFYLSPGYGLALMKRKMLSACDRQKRGRDKGRNSSSSRSRANFFVPANVMLVGRG